MATLDEACTALASAAATVDGLRAKGWLDDQINPPEAQVFTREFDPRLVFDTSPTGFALGLRVFARRNDPRSAQKVLRGFMEPDGTGSVRAALEDETNWPDGTHYVAVTGIGQPFVYETAAGESYVAVDFEVEAVF